MAKTTQHTITRDGKVIVYSPTKHQEKSTRDAIPWTKQPTTVAGKVWKNLVG